MHYPEYSAYYAGGFAVAMIDGFSITATALKFVAAALPVGVIVMRV